LIFPSTVTVQGIGTFDSAANFIYNGDEGPGSLELADVENRLGIQSDSPVTTTPTNVGPVSGFGSVIDGCDPAALSRSFPVLVSL
jgi:hypothetical protein